MTFGDALKVRSVVEDAGVVLWEGGEKTTPEIKRDIVDLLDQVDSLVALVDLKAAERPDDPRWWPSLRVIHAWLDEDPFFAKAIDQWKHARQERILERVIWDLNGNPAPLTKSEMALLKERVKFASSTLSRIVNRGMREKVDVETNTNHLHLHANLSDEALQEKLNQLRRNPQVRALLTLGGVDSATGQVMEAEIMPPGPRPAPAPIEFQDPSTLGASLVDGEP